MIRGARFVQCSLTWLLFDPHGPHSTTRRRNAQQSPIRLSLALLKRLTAASWRGLRFAKMSTWNMSLLIALMVLVVAQLGLHAFNAPAGPSYVVSVGLGIAALVVLDRKRSR